MFDGISGLIIFIAVFAAIVLISQKFKANLGIIAFVGAYIFGRVALGYQNSDMIGFFPTNLFLTQLLVTLFFGYVLQTGLFAGIADRVVNLTHNVPWSLPFILFAASIVIGLLGAGNEATPLVISPLAYSFAISAGFNPLLSIMACYFGSCWAGAMPWTSGALLFSFAETIGKEEGSRGMWAAIVIEIILMVLFFIVAYFVLKGHKTQNRVERRIVEPFTRAQKMSLVILVSVIALIIIPGIINSLFPNPVFAWIAGHFDIRVVCLLGCLAYVLTGLGDSVDCLKNRVPWGLLMMITGTCMFVNVGASYGIVDTIASILGENVPTILVPAAITLAGGILSFVTNGVVIWPLFMAMVPGLAIATGLNPVMLTACVMMSTVPAGISPISTGGAMAVIGWPEEARQKYFWKQFGVGAVFVAVNLVFALCGGYTFIVNIMS